MYAPTTKSRPEIFAWSAKYKIGIAAVDTQHKKLVSLINNLARLQVSQADPEELLRVFDELANYAAYHFRTEEELMRRYRVDPSFEAGHRAAHADFVRQAAEAREAASERPGEVTTRTLAYLSRWLIAHILGTDMRMANEILALEKGLSPEQARKHAEGKVADANDILLGAMNQLYENLADRTHDFLEANNRLREEIESRRSTEFELRKLSLAVETSPASIIITDAEGKFVYVNPKFVEVTGYTLQELAGQTPRVLRSEHTPTEVCDGLWTTIAAGRPWSGELRNRRKNGELYWDRVSITPMFDVDGRITNFLSIHEDISERKHAEDELRASHSEQAAALAEMQRQAHDLTLINEMNGLLQTCLTAEEAYRVVAHMAERLGLGSGGALAVASGEDRVLRRVARWGSGPELLPSFGFDACWAIRRGQRHEVCNPEREPVCSHFHEPIALPYQCIPLVVLGETLGMLHVTTAPHADTGARERLGRLAVTVGEALKLTLSNIRLREALREQATRDPLTGLFNRRYFDEVLERESQRAARQRSPLSVVVADIDRFKEFNDSCGHEAGDRALIHVAAGIRAGLRQSDVACRIGGDEIAVVMPASTAADAARRMEEIAAGLRALNIAVGAAVLPTLGISVGVASYPEHQADGETLLRAADRALYEAKTTGRDRVCVAATAASGRDAPPTS